MAVKRDTRYPGRWSPADADFPLGGPKNRTAPTSQDGSYFNRDFIADYEAFFQRLMVEGGVTVNEAPDTAPTSQFYDAIISVIENNSKSGIDQYDPLALYNTGDVCYTIDTSGVIPKKNYWEWYSNVESLAGKDPSDSLNRQDGWTDETKPFYWTPHKKARPGTPLWPWMSMTFPEGTLNVVGNSVPKAVFWRLAEAFPEFINGDFIDFPETGGEFFRVLDQGRGVDTDRVFGVAQESSIVCIGDPSKSGPVPSTFVNWVDDHPLTMHENLNSDGVASPSGIGRAYASSAYSTGVSTYTDTGMYVRPRNLAFPILVEV